MRKLIPLMLILLLISTTSADAFWGSVNKSATKTLTKIAKISKNTNALPDDEIIRLSKLSDEVKGTKKIGKELGQLNLPKEVLEDTYARIAIYQGKISRDEAEGIFRRLSGTPGLRSTLSKIIGNSQKKTAGHLNELWIADKASKNGFKVLGIGEKFSDGLKHSPTDIDIVLKKGNKTFIVEAKEYLSTTKMPLDKYRADLDTLVQYKKKSKTKKEIPIFSLTNKPNDPRYLKMLQHEADKRGVQLIFGSPGEQIEKIKLLGQILHY